MFTLSTSSFSLKIMYYHNPELIQNNKTPFNFKFYNYSPRQNFNYFIHDKEYVLLWFLNKWVININYRKYING